MEVPCPNGCGINVCITCGDPSCPICGIDVAEYVENNQKLKAQMDLEITNGVSCPMKIGIVPTVGTY